MNEKETNEEKLTITKKTSNKHIKNEIRESLIIQHFGSYTSNTLNKIRLILDAVHMSIGGR